MKLAERMGRFGASPTMAAKQAATDLRARGIDVIDFSVGEPDFPTPAHIVKAAQESLGNGETHYTSGAGVPELRSALATELTRLAGGRTIAADSIVVTCGGKSALLYAILALVGPGDEVIIPTPCWVSFPDQVRLAGGRPVFVSCSAEDGFRPRAETLVDAMTERTRLVIVNSPANPTGALMAEDQWPALIDACAARDAMLLSDETYNELVYDTAGVPSALRHGDADAPLIVVNSFSKTYAMTGWRVGYLQAPQELSRAVLKLQSQDTTHPATFAQRAAVEALTGPRGALEEMKVEYIARRDLVLEEIEQLDGFHARRPDGAFYVFPDVAEAMRRKGCKDDGEFTVRLLTEAHVAVVQGSAFHGPGCVRISYAASQSTLRDGMQRIRDWMGRS